MIPVRSLLAFFPCITLFIAASPGILLAQPHKFEGKKVINIRPDIYHLLAFEFLGLRQQNPGRCRDEQSDTREEGEQRSHRNHFSVRLYRATLLPSARM